MLIVAFGVFAAEATHPFTLVIDPGHGGKDYGCIGDITNEKTIVLDVASRVGKLIAQEHPEVKIIYTRTDDRFIELNERAAIANRASADLFISVHVNSVDKKTKGREKTHGASVYTLGLHRTDANLAVAMRENSVIELENDFSEVYQGFDPNSSESYIIFELTQNRHQHNSVELADAIEQELVSTAGRADKGVLQSGFLVLRATSMPAVLVELDFICCPEAERFLASSDGKDTCARAIANAFATYYARHGAKTSTAKAASTTTSTAQASAPKATQSAAAASSPSAATYYAVQFLTSPKQLAADDSQLKGIDNVNYYFHENLYKYYSGNFTSLKDAKKLLRQIQKTHPQAFIIKMRNGQRVNSN
jgi:N-acetylmuramoyl-L-alanine amidase